MILETMNASFQTVFGRGQVESEHENSVKLVLCVAMPANRPSNTRFARIMPFCSSRKTVLSGPSGPYNGQTDTTPLNPNGARNRPMETRHHARLCPLFLGALVVAALPATAQTVNINGNGHHETKEASDNYGHASRRHTEGNPWGYGWSHVGGPVLDDYTPGTGLPADWWRSPRHATEAWQLFVITDDDGRPLPGLVRIKQAANQRASRLLQANDTGSVLVRLKKPMRTHVVEVERLGYETVRLILTGGRLERQEHAVVVRRGDRVRTEVRAPDQRGGPVGKPARLYARAHKALAAGNREAARTRLEAAIELWPLAGGQVAVGSTLLEYQPYRDLEHLGFPVKPVELPRSD